MAFIDTFGSLNPAIVTNGLAFYYSFENPACYVGVNSRVAYDLQSGLSASLQSAAVISPHVNTGSLVNTGLANKSINCQSDRLTYLSASTICYWANFNGSSGQQGGVLAAGSSVQRYFQSALRNNYGGFTGLEWYSSFTGEYTSAAMPSVTGWHFYTVTWQNVSGSNSQSSCSINFYQDSVGYGHLITPPNGFQAAYQGTVTIGYDFYSTYMRGAIQSVFIYNRVLSDAEIAYNYSATKWRF